MWRMPEFDPSIPSIARVYDYWLGGKNHFKADRELGAKLLEQYPPTADIVRENKRFLTRAITWVAEQGIAQFIDLGAGMPTSPNTLETVRAVAPDAGVVLVDNDPVVIAHLTALLAEGYPGVTVVANDVREIKVVLAEVAAGIDLGSPACLILGSLLHFFPVDVGQEMVSGYLAALAPGSYVIFSIGRSVGAESERFIAAYRKGGSALYYYTADDIAALFSALELVPPGIIQPRSWHPVGPEPLTIPPRQGDLLAGVATVRA